MISSKIKKVLLLGSGALQIGQAGEFDYSGSQAIKALKEDGIEVILINPNIATIQTSQNFADKVYFLPVDPHFVEEIIKAEKPDGMLLSFGGQTALNCGLEMHKNGVLKKHSVKILGTPIEAIEKTEDRHLFAKSLKEICLSIPKSMATNTLQKAKQAAKQIGYPVMIRGGFSLGGQDSGVARNEKELVEISSRALSKVNQILIEEYLAGWKEIEYEVVRDKFDNCITVCNMENIDPMGIHTGESIVVAPSQTLDNWQYHGLREIAIKVIRYLGIIGECNIQFALNPRPLPSTIIASEAKQSKKKIATSRRSGTRKDNSIDYRIIEVNARLSRSSALASKATGYPLAYVATKLALDQNLIDIKNSVTRKTIAAFEPALDYLVVKIPRWDLAKFVKSNDVIGSSMQSVGEVMAIGRKFEEALQKAVRMLDISMETPLDEKAHHPDYSKPTPWRIFAIAQALKKGVSVEKIAQKTAIDPFFLSKIKNIADLEKELLSYSSSGVKRSREVTAKNYINSKVSSRQARTIKADKLLIAKQLGFSDKRIAHLVNSTEQEIANLRNTYNIHPVVKQIDTLAAEYPAETNYLYLTYNGEKDDLSVFAGGSRGRDPDPTSLRFEGQDSATFAGGLARRSSAMQSVGGRETTDRTRNASKVLVLGSGPYRIGSSVEFDWCAVNSAQTAAKSGFSPIIINCNPETVSTDYDMAEKLYFEELTTETVNEIYQKENVEGIIVSMGGQTPNNLTPDLFKLNLKILGTDPASIDRAEDRSKFSDLCDELKINQPPWAKLANITDATDFAKKIGYPVLVRPSYVLSGAAMNVAFNSDDLRQFLLAASRVSSQYPVVISKFFKDAKEFEIDAVAKSGQILTFAITEHIENAGVHSGDSHIVWPAQKLNKQTSGEVLIIAKKIAGTLKITGPFNIQFLAVNNKVSVIECNLRASRSLPFVSKVTGQNFAQIATEAILGQNTKYRIHDTKYNYVAVKAPQFSFARVKGSDPVLRVEMASTGEVACFGDDIYEAFLKATLSTGMHLPKKSVFISLAGDKNKAEFLESAKTLAKMGLKIYASAGTSKFLKEKGIENHMLHKIHEHKKPNVLNVLMAKKIDLVINIFDPYFKKEFDDDYQIRRNTLDFGIPLLTNMQTAKLFTRAISLKKISDLKALPWNSYVAI